MSKGIIYIMTTIVHGLIKIGKTRTGDFESSMNNLERNGYSNVTGLRRYFAIEVDDYEKKEILLGDIFSKSRVENTELFALDVNLVVQLLSSFEGDQIYPKDTPKEKASHHAVYNQDIKLIPEGEYFFERNNKAWGFTAKGTMKVKQGKIIIKKGSTVCPIDGVGITEELKASRAKARIINNVLQEDIEVSSPSAAATFLTGGAVNGWCYWKTKDGKMIDIFRKHGKKRH